MIVQYQTPNNWILYNVSEIVQELTAAKAAIIALTQMPYQRSWADELQKIQLKREVAGTSRIEGADFTDKELDAAMSETPDQLHTRSQKQATAAVKTYRWIAQLPEGQPINTELICQIHASLVRGCDEDHCPPGQIRGKDHNVTFGVPRHRGVAGGEECSRVFERLCQAVNAEFRGHDPLIQAFALHYHFAAMHPFLDGNGRTARALEALMLQRIGLRDTLFIAMSNYYYEEKHAYLSTLSQTRSRNHELTPFLKFALAGVEKQCRRLFNEIRLHVSKALFRNTYTDLFGRLKSPRKRVVSGRHVRILNLMLDVEEIKLDNLISVIHSHYQLKSPFKAIIRDLNYLIHLKALHVRKLPDNGGYMLSINLDWPAKITETEFFKSINKLPKGKLYSFLSK